MASAKGGLQLRLQGSVLKKVLEAIKDVMKTTNLDCSATCLSLQSMNSSISSMVYVRLRSEGFEYYKCDDNISVDMNINTIAEILTCDSCEITRKTNDGKNNTFTFIVNGLDGRSVFEINLLKIGNQHLPPMPFDGDYHVTIRMPSAKFVSICEKLCDFGDVDFGDADVEDTDVEDEDFGDADFGDAVLVISVTNEKEVTLCTIGDIGTITYFIDEEHIIMMDKNQPFSSTFSLKQLKPFAKATAISNTVTISMSSGLPIRVEYEIAEMGSVRFYLFPKVKE